MLQGKKIQKLIYMIFENILRPKVLWIGRLLLHIVPSLFTFVDLKARNSCN